MRRRGALLPFLVALSALVGAGAPALAAIPPDVVPDATVVVVVNEPGDGSAAGAPVAGATVAIRATRDGQVIQELSGVSGSDGRAALSGVARATGGSAVTIEVTASLEHQAVDANGCTTAASWSGQATAPVSSTAVEVRIVATAASSIQCPPQSPGGSVLAATGRPRPTPPPTDAIGGSGSDRPRGGLVLAVAGALLLAGAATLESTRRRRQTVRRSR